jgi:class 3 adenylate cyclase
LYLWLTVICQSCGTSNQAGANFCIQCGTRLALACPACGHGNLPNARFCANCGSALPETAQPGAAAPLAMAVAERRLVSVLFVDLVGFTTRSEDRDPEEVRELLSRYFEVARRIVEGHGGTVEKFIGDAVMAVWGAPTAHEDDAERAVRSALAIVAGVGSIADGEQPLHARAGVLTGEAAVTVGAEGQGLVAGDLVNTASRLQSVAQPGTVLVGEATYRATSNAISYEPAGERVLKGKTSPVPAWRAVAVVARRGGSGRASTLEPPFVGREDELQQLKDLFDATGRERKPRLVTVIGQAGIGKSRLAWEFEKYLDGVVETAFWHEGRTPAYGEGISYWALAEMVRVRAQISEGEAPETARPKLAAMLEQFIDDPAERRFVEPRLAGLLGLAELPSDGREELFAAWRTLFERIATQAPTVLVFVDMHWADQGLLDFVEDLLAWARSSPIFVVALARPELLERRPDWGSGVRSVTRINLEPLSAQDMARLLEGLVPGLPADAVDRIVARSEGIPLYAVETVRMLLDTGSVVPEDDHYVLRGDLSELAVAETLHALIAARLDANTPEDRSLIQDAAVLGLSFTLDALAAVSGRDVAQLEPALERLTRRQLLVPDNDPRSPERGQYRFVQALLREVAYQSLAKPDRRTRHLAAARHFESLGEDELAGVLANHYLDAYRASREGPEADAVAAQARIATLAAADRATALHSHRQAIAYLQQALIVTGDAAERAAIHERICRAAEPGAMVELGFEHGRLAAETYRQLGDLVGALRAATALARNMINFHLEDEAATTLDQAIRDAEPLGEVPQLGGAYAELARAHMLKDRHPEAVEAADRALVLAADHQTETTVEALITKGTSLGVIGRNVEAEATLRGAIHLADRLGLIQAAVRARNNLSGPIGFADLAESETLMREGYEMSRRYGHRPFLYQFLMVLMQAAFRRGAWDEWLPELRAIRENESLPLFYDSGLLGVEAQLTAMQGDLAGGRRLLDQATQLRAQLQSDQAQAYMDLMSGYLAVIEGSWPQAASLLLVGAANSNFVEEGSYMSAVAAAAGNLPDALDAAIDVLSHPLSPGRTSQAMLEAAMAARAARQGREDEARAGFAHAHSELTAAGELLYANLAGLLWAALAGERHPDAAAAGSEAEAFFTERGADAFVRQFRDRFVATPAAPGEQPAADSREAVPAGEG